MYFLRRKKQTYKAAKLFVLCPTLTSGLFIDIKSFRSHYGPGVNSASDRNEYQEHFLREKAAGA